MFTYAAALSQAVPAATPQVCRRHMRTRLKSNFRNAVLSAILVGQCNMADTAGPAKPKNFPEL